MKECHCGSGIDYGQCCGPYLAGEKQPPTAEALMRSRYTAYVVEDYSYVLRTCHSSTRPDDDEFDDSTPVKWTGLEIIETGAGGEGDDEGTVEFIARYQGPHGILGMHEKGSFVREDGQWFYLDGVIIKAPPVRSQKVIDCITLLLALIFAFFLAKENWRMGFDAWQAKDFATTYPHVPLYPSKIAVSIGISLLCLQIIADWVGSIKELFGFEGQNNN